MVSSIFCADLAHDFLNARRVNATVQNQTRHRFARDFSSHRIETGEDDGIGRVVNQNGDPGGGFECADVASVAADDAALHFLALESDGGRGGFESVFARVALNGEADDRPGFFLGAGFRVLQNVAGQFAGVADGLLLDLLQELRARFLLGNVRHVLQLFAPLCG